MLVEHQQAIKVEGKDAGTRHQGVCDGPRVVLCQSVHAIVEQEEATKESNNRIERDVAPEDRFLHGLACLPQEARLFLAKQAEQKAAHADAAFTGSRLPGAVDFIGSLQEGGHVVHGL